MNTLNWSTILPTKVIIYYLQKENLLKRNENCTAECLADILQARHASLVLSYLLVWTLGR